VEQHLVNRPSHIPVEWRTIKPSETRQPFLWTFIRQSQNQGSTSRHDRQTTRTGQRIDHGMREVSWPLSNREDMANHSASPVVEHDEIIHGLRVSERLNTKDPANIPLAVCVVDVWYVQPDIGVTYLGH